MATPDSSIAKLKLVELVRTLNEGGRLAAELAEQLPESAAALNALATELYNSATELKDAWDGRRPATSEKQDQAPSVVAMGAEEFWGVFDADDLSAEEPVAFALFATETEAKGFSLLCMHGCVTPAIRLCRASGTVQADVAPNEVANDG